MKKILVTFNCNKFALNRTYINHRSFVRFFGCSREPGPSKMSQGGGKKRERDKERGERRTQDINTYTNANLIPPLSILLGSLSNYT